MSRRGIVRAGVTLAAMGILGACGEPTAAAGSSFVADVTGTTVSRLAGTAMASGSDSWSRELALQVTVPGGQTFTGVGLVANDRATTISLMRAGTSLPVGTWPVGRAVSAGVAGVSASYAVRQGDGLKLSVADSGQVVIEESGSRVKGRFTIHLSHYDVIPAPTPANVGQPITPVASGTEPLTIEGRFDAARR